MTQQAIFVTCSNASTAASFSGDRCDDTTDSATFDMPFFLHDCCRRSSCIVQVTFFEQISLFCLNFGLAHRLYITQIRRMSEEGQFFCIHDVCFGHYWSHIIRVNYNCCCCKERARLSAGAMEDDRAWKAVGSLVFCITYWASQVIFFCCVESVVENGHYDVFQVEKCDELKHSIQRTRSGHMPLSP